MCKNCEQGGSHYDDDYRSNIDYRSKTEIIKDEWKQFKKEIKELNKKLNILEKENNKLRKIVEKLTYV